MTDRLPIAEMVRFLLAEKFSTACASLLLGAVDARRDADRLDRLPPP